MKKKLLSRLLSLALALVLVAVLLPSFAMEAEAWTGIVANDGFTVRIDAGHPLGSSYRRCHHYVYKDESTITVTNNNGTLTISGTLVYDNCSAKKISNSFSATASGFSCETDHTGGNSLDVDPNSADEVHLPDGTNLDISLMRSAGHAVSSWTSSNNQHSGTCSLCGETVTENCSGGKATCVAPATCSTCNQLYGSADTVNGHDWSAWTTDDTTHSRKCLRDGCGKTESGNHTTVGGAAASCTTPNRCGICNVEYGTVDMVNGHDYSSWSNALVDGEWKHWQVCSHDETHTTVQEACSVGTNGTPATCVALATCGTCGQSFGNALDHNYTYAVSDATITESCDKGCGHSTTATLSANSLTYKGTEQTGLTMACPDWKGEPPVLSATATNAGTYTGTMTHTTSEGTLSVSKEFTIAPALLDDAVVTLSPSTFTYDGTAKKPSHTVSLAGFGTLVEGRDYVAGYLGAMQMVGGVPTKWFGKPADAPLNAECIDVNTYGVIIRGVEGGNFRVSESKEQMGVYGTFTIEKAEPTVTAPKAKTDLVYAPGIDHALVEAGSTTVGEMRYSMSENGTYSSIPEASDAGTYKVWYKAVVDETDPNYINYTSSAPDYVEVTIAKAEPDFTHPSPKPGLVYNGTEQSLVTVTNAGANEGGYVYRLDEESAWENDVTGKDAGDYTVYWKFTPVDANYATVEDSFTATVKRAALPDGISFNYTEPTDLIYNGQEQAVTVTLGTALSGVTAEHITLNYSDTPKNAGDYTFTISIAQSGNYEASTAPLTNDAWKFTINKAKPVIKWDPKEFTYNGAPQGEATVELIGSDTYTGSIQYSYGPNESTGRPGLPTGAGTYVVYASTETLDNYEAEVEKETIRISPKAVTPTVVIEPEYFTYDGTAKEPAVKVMDDETEIPAKEYNVAYTGDTKQVGAATVTVSDKENGNYTVGTVSKVYLILPDASALDGVTTDNVNSSHQAAIDEIQAAMSGKNIDGASVIATGRWRSLVDRCARLETKLIAVDGAEDALDDAISDLPQQPKTSDLEKITDILEQYEALEDNLTDAEKKALEDEIGQLEDLKAAIIDTNAALKEVTDGTASLDEDELVFADKATIKDLLEEAEDLQSNPYLTDDQVIALADSKEQLEKLEDKFAGAEKVEADYLNKLPAEADPDDEDAIKAYEAAKKAYTDLGTAGKAKVDPKAVKKLEGLRTELTDYEIIKGSGAKWVKGSSKGLTFTANGYHPHFEGVEIDGKLIDDDYYTDKSGSTIVTLKASYLQKLKTGKHTITILFGDGDYTGEAEGTFKVSYTADSPATGDSSNVILPVCLAIGSLLCLAVLVVNRKKFYQK